MWYFYRVFIMPHCTIITRWWGDRTFPWWDEMGKGRKHHGPEFGCYIRATLAPGLSHATVPLYTRQLVSGEQVGRMHNTGHWARIICNGSMVRDFTMLHDTYDIRVISFQNFPFDFGLKLNTDNQKSRQGSHGQEELPQRQPRSVTLPYYLERRNTLGLNPFLVE